MSNEDLETDGVYKYFTPEVIEQFDGTGSENLIQIIESPDQSDTESNEAVGLIFIELLMVYQEGKLDLDKVTEFLSLAIKEEELAIQFCQVLTIFIIDDALGKLLSRLYQQQKIIKPSTIGKYISGEVLSAVSIIPQDTYNKQLNVRKRDEYYTQKKYNLLHQESEGFARIIVEVYNILRLDETDYQVDYALKVTETIAGHYNLDPNKVLDLILECFLNNLVGNEKFIINFLQKSQWWPVKQGDISSIETLSVGGNESAAKMIGLKLLKYPSEKDLPETFKLLITILIKIGFISFGSIYKFLRPDDEKMNQLEELYKKELEDEVFKSSASALALAAPLKEDEDEDEDKSKSKPSSGSGSSSKKNETQAPKLLQEELHVNFKFQLLRSCLSNGLYWPSIYILTEYPFLAKVDDEIISLICRLIDHMISPLYNQITPFSQDEFKELGTSKKVTVSRAANTVGFQDFSCSNYLSFKATIQNYSQKHFVYFYQDWKTQLPMINTVDDLFEVSRDFLKFVDVKLSKNINLFSKICDIGVWDLENHINDEQKLGQWFTYFRNVIFPSTPLLQENSIAIDKAYKILSFYPKEDRFNLYSEMHQVLSKNNPLIKITYGKAEKSTKDVLKRLSKETVQSMMRRIAKVSFSNPLPCFLTILQQIESYDNLNTLVVETARYFNAYGWDVLTLAIMMRITATGRSNVQMNGLNERQWIQSLASFIGKICQRYPNAIDLETLIKFLLKSLHNNETIGLIILKEIFISMGGIQTITNLTPEQIYKINSGTTLQKQVYNTIKDLRYERMESGKSLLRTLIQLDVINELLVLLCQVDDYVVYGSDETHLKILANRKDDLLTVIRLFITLVNFFSDSEIIQNNLKSIADLAANYNVPPVWVFELWRNYLSSDSNEKVSNHMVDFKQYFDDLVWDNLSVELYGVFWQLSLYDINFSDELYDQAIERINASTPALESTYNKSKHSLSVSRQNLDDQRAELFLAWDYSKQLPVDKEAHMKHNQVINDRLNTESSLLFKDNDLKSQIRNFLQHCVLPRSIHSSFDAVYCARFLFKLQEVKTSNFSIVDVLKELIDCRILFSTLFTSTPTESENLGIFFSEILGGLNRLCNEEEFNRLKETSPLTQEQNELDFNSYRKVLFEFHSVILEDVGRALETVNYMCRRNSITFFKNLLGVYPSVEDHCERVVGLIENIVENEKREDLKLAASALIGHVKSRAKSWVHMWDFMEMEESDKQKQIEKREEIQAKIRQEQEDKKRKQEEEKQKQEEQKRKQEEEKRQRELKAKEERELEELKKKEANKLNYNEEPKKGGRNEIRGNDIKNRYDYYSKYEQQKETNGDDKMEVDIEDKEKESRELKESEELKESLKDSKNTRESNTRESKDKPVAGEKSDKPDKKETPESEKSKQNDTRNGKFNKQKDSDSKPNRPRDRPKSEERAEAKDFRQHPSRQDSGGRSGRDSGTSTPDSQRGTPEVNRGSNYYPQDRKRDSVRFNDRGSKGYNNNNNNNRQNNQRNYRQPSQPRGYSNNQGNGRGNSTPLAPPPPPPPPPPVELKPDNRSRHGSNNNGGRHDNRKRRHDSHDRGNDKRQKY